MKNITRRGFLQLTADGSGVCGSTADGMREEK